MDFTESSFMEKAAIFGVFAILAFIIISASASAIGYFEIRDQYENCVSAPQGAGYDAICQSEGSSIACSWGFVYGTQCVSADSVPSVVAVPYRR